MKKQIKDLTLKEKRRICETFINCTTCPLRHIDIPCEAPFYQDNEDFYDYMNTEVEVDD